MPYLYNAAGTSLGNFGGVGNRFLFTGREWIKDLRVYDYRHRMYQPELGRFLQPDPKQFEAGDYNLYRYCHNDPVNKSDPTGLAGGSLIGRVITFIRGVPGSEKSLKEIRSIKEGVSAYGEGEDVRMKTEKLAREVARETAGGKTPIKHKNKFGEHYHDADGKGGHAFWGSAGLATTRSVLSDDDNVLLRGIANVMDFINPILIVNDIKEVAESMRSQAPVDADEKK